MTGNVFAAEPYFITIERLDLKVRDGEWVKIVEPDHRVDLMSTQPTLSFFNNGRVPSADFENFRLTFDDHGTERVITRKVNYDTPIPVRKGSFIRIWFLLDFELNFNGTPVRPQGVKELELTIDDVVHIEDNKDSTYKGDVWF